MAKSNLDNIAIHVEEAEQTARSIQSAELQPIAEMFSRNTHNLMCLLCLPDMLLTTGNMRVQHAHFYDRAIIRVRTKMGTWGESKQAKAEFDAEVDAEVRRLTAAANEDSEYWPKLHAEREAQLSNLLENHEFREAIRVLLYASCSSAWAAFECAVKDAWIAALNSRPLQLAQPTMGKLPEERTVEDLTGKQIAVGLLARHGFDLRDKLGTLLAPKFDFTSVSGMQAALGAAFRGVPNVEQAVTDPNLGILEATRHLIVHRAGLIDEEYQRRTGESAAAGQQLQLNGARVSELANASILAGCKLLRAVDAWLLANPTIPRAQ